MSIQEHISRTDNPHGLTKAQIGLSNVQNFPLANEQEVMELVRNDRYIDMNNLEWVSNSFRTYMEELGIIDSQGNYLSKPIDSLGTIIFYRDPDGVSYLYGSHPEAYKLNATITLDGVEEANYQNVIIDNNNNWSIDISNLGLIKGSNYKVEINYYNGNNKYLYTKSLFNKDTKTQTQFQIDSFNRDATISGAVSGFDSIGVIITENGTNISETLNINTNLGGWTIDLSTITFSTNKTYVATVKHYISGELILTTQSTATQTDAADGTLYYTDPETGTNYYDFRRYENMTDVGLYYVDQGEL